MAKKFGLGKGLGALIPEDNIKEEKKEKGGIINIELKDIKANKKQPRKFFDNNKLNELAESVKEHGIIQPLILKKEEKGYSIIAGERRYRAAKIAELTEVPALIMDISKIRFKSYRRRISIWKIIKRICFNSRRAFKNNGKIKNYNNKYNEIIKVRW